MLSEFGNSSPQGHESSENTCFNVLWCNQPGADDPWPISADFLNPRFPGLLPFSEDWIPDQLLRHPWQLAGLRGSVISTQGREALRREGLFVVHLLMCPIFFVPLQTAKSTHHPHKIDDQHRECKTGGGAYFAFLLGSRQFAHHPLKNTARWRRSFVGMVRGWRSPTFGLLVSSCLFFPNLQKLGPPGLAPVALCYLSLQSALKHGWLTIAPPAAFRKVPATRVRDTSGPKIYLT